MADEGGGVGVESRNLIEDFAEVGIFVHKQEDCRKADGQAAVVEVFPNKGFFITHPKTGNRME